MPQISSDQLRDLSVRVVEDFLNNKVPLSSGLAKQASAMELNSDQVQRAVEATNTIAYLKILGMSEDRTVEFPLCKYAEVMASIALPEKQATAGKAALANGLLPEEDSPGSAMSKSAEIVVHKTSAIGKSEVMVDFSNHEKTVFFIKEAAAVKSKLEDLEGQSHVITAELLKLAKAVNKDEKGMDKLASVSKDEFQALSALVTGTASMPRDLPEGMFKEAELKDVTKLTQLYKQAKQIVAETAKLRELDKRASELSGEMTKQAFVSALAKGIATPIAAGVKAIGSAAAMPLKAMNNAAAGTSLGKSVGLKAMEYSKPQKRVSMALGVAGASAVPAMDAAMYRSNGGPGYTHTGQSKDVWDALQS